VYNYYPEHEMQKLESLNPQQHGAAEARRAHNPEVPGSKPGAAIFSFCFGHHYLVEFEKFYFLRRQDDFGLSAARNYGLRDLRDAWPNYFCLAVLSCMRKFSDTYPFVRSGIGPPRPPHSKSI
jgi:glycosyltransferase involved in cell wall biosynthesis